MENVENLNPEVETDSGIKLNQRFLSCYRLIEGETDVAEMMTDLLFAANEYSHAQVLSNELNGRQGKNRKVYDGDKRALMNYSFEEDVDMFIDKQLDDLLVNSLNMYLADKQELPTSPKFAAGIENRVKALLIMLFGTGQLGIIPRLNVPTYVLPYVKKATDKIFDTKEDALEGWIMYLEDSGNEKLAEIVRSIGNEFWGSDTVNAQDVFQRHFQNYLKDIKDYEKTYQMYLYYRNEYMKLTRRVTMNRLYETFDMTSNQFDKGKKAFINEFPQMFSEDETANLILKVIYEE